MSYAVDNSNVSNIFLLHGKKRAATNTIDGWKSRLKSTMESKGMRVIAPFVDNSRKIYGKDWENEIDAHKDSIDENTIFVGHSAGATAFVRRLGNNPQKKIQKMFLIAPAKIPEGAAKRFSTQTGEPLDPEEYEGIKDLYDFVIDTSIRNRVTDGIFVITSNDEQRLLDSARLYIDALHATHIVLDGRGHFNSFLGEINHTLPEIIPYIESHT